MQEYKYGPYSVIGVSLPTLWLLLSSSLLL